MTEAAKTSEASEHDCDVLILGGSFMGVELVRRLRRDARGRGLSIIVVDRQQTHPYIPLGHELLTGRMAQSVEAHTVLDSAKYLGSLSTARWERGEISSFDPDTHCVELEDGRRLSGRFVVIALGSEVRPPRALPGAERMLAYKSAAQFQRCTTELERVLNPDSPNPDTPRPVILVAGGGITGVEIAGELAHLASQRPSGWRAPEVVMVQSGPRLLPGLTPRAGHRAAAALRRQGVDLRLDTRLVRVDEATVTISDSQGETTLPCALSFWAGGLQPPAVVAELGLPTTAEGWLDVGPTLQCFPASTDEPEIFAGGDVARVRGGSGRWPTMQRAIEAIFAATSCARNILTLARSPADYPVEVPPLHPHRLWSDFPHGVSVGGESLLVYGRLVLPLSGLNIWFRRFLMRRYMARYRG